MRWSIVKLIWGRELRDLLRDRRTLFMMLGLPVVLYPVFGVVGFAFALSMLGLPLRVGVVGGENLPKATPKSYGTGPAADVAWLAAAPTGGDGPERLVAAWALSSAAQRFADPPPLLLDGKFIEPPGDTPHEGELEPIPLADADPAALADRRVDVILVVPPDLMDQLARGGKATVKLQGREGDETSKLAARRLNAALKLWQQRLKEARFVQKGLPPDFDEAIEVEDETAGKTEVDKAAAGLRDALSKVFPFILVMWTLAGALHPAIDLCAGEKERGTMETLLISPTSRGEIVAGKFLATWVFSAGTALWNLAFMGGGAWLLGLVLPFPVLRLAGLGWCAFMVLPLAALFSAVSLGLGVYARSTKEGQYYLMPVFFVTLPLILLSLAPGIELTVGYSLVPVTGLSLLLQKLLSVAPQSPYLWAYFVPVFGSQAACLALALWWAVRQFHREDVLFREAERLDLGQRLRRLLGRRPKPEVPPPD
jgi:sodium transport system permease protein